MNRVDRVLWTILIICVIVVVLGFAFRWVT
jgi:hypothetical protein